MLLNPSDLQSPTWLKIKKHVEERVESHRSSNDGRLSESDTAHLRGRIAEAKYLLALADPPIPVIPAA